MADKKYTDEQEQIARFAKAMGHPARMAILQFLLRQETCFFGDIHEELPIAKATVSQHLKELKEAGLIQGEIEAPKVKYCINKENWALAQKMFAGFFGQQVCKKESLLRLSRLFFSICCSLFYERLTLSICKYEKDFIFISCMLGFCCLRDEIQD